MPLHRQVAGRRSKPGTTIDAPACSIDLFPTHPRSLRRRRATRSRRRRQPRAAAARARRVEARRALLALSALRNQGGRPGGAVRAGDYKLIEFYEDGRRELFDVTKDVGESRNLAAEKPDVVQGAARRSSTRGGRRSARRCRRRTPTTCPTRRRRTARSRCTRARREVHGVHAPLRAAAAQEHARLLDEQGRLGDLGVHRRRSRARSPSRCCKAAARAAAAARSRSPSATQTLTFTVEGHRRLPELQGPRRRHAEDREGRPAHADGEAEDQAGAAVMDLRQVMLKPEK